MDRKAIWHAGRALVVIAALLASEQCFAQAYPTKPIRLIVPYAVGGQTDIIARIIQPKLNEGLGKPVVIDNRSGGASIIGTELVAKAMPDGYNIVMGSTAHSINASLYTNLPYDSVKDFTPVIMIAQAPLMLVIYPVLPVRSVEELIRLAKSKPGALNYGAAGVGSGTYLAGAIFNSMASVNIVAVTYRSTGLALIDLLSGYTQLVFSPLLPAVPLVKSGKLKALAVTSAKRLPEMPNLPAVAETLPGYEYISWYGVLAPARAPKAIVQRLNAEIERVLSLPEIHRSLADQSLQVVGGTPEQFASYIQQSIEKFGVIIKQLGLRVEL